jgi:hypothetical protein
MPYKSTVVVWARLWGNRGMEAKGEGLVTWEEIGQLISSMGLVRREGQPPKELYLKVLSDENQGGSNWYQSIAFSLLFSR